MRTKKARLEHARVLLDRQKQGVPFSAESISILNNLTGWDAIGACKVFNQAHPSDTRCVQITLPTGEQAVWSWRKAITGYDPIHNVQQALRSAVAPYLAAYVLIAEKRCAVCGATEDLTADHKDVPFSALVKMFMKDWPDLDVCVVNTCTGEGWKLKEHIHDKWIEHHNAHATYQVLCRSCNASKGTN